jgi:hypothetical protein
MVEDILCHNAESTCLAKDFVFIDKCTTVKFPKLEGRILDCFGGARLICCSGSFHWKFWRFVSVSHWKIKVSSLNIKSIPAMSGSSHSLVERFK